MSGSKKFFVLFISVLMLLICASSSLAITSITSTLTPTSYSTEGIPILTINQGENFSVTLTAENPIGEIYWSLALYNTDTGNIEHDNNNVTLSSTTGNTVTVSGTLSASSYSIGVTATDISAANPENLAITYNFWVQANSSPSPSPTPTPTPTPVPDSGDSSYYYTRNSGDS